jgi:hypothetical protein
MMVEILTVDRTALEQARQEAGKLWREIYEIIKGKKFSSFNQVSISVPVKLNGYSELRLHLTNGFLGNGKFRVYLKNSKDSLALNVSRGFVSVAGKDGTVIASHLLHPFRVEVFKAVKPVIASLGQIMVEDGDNKVK